MREKAQVTQRRKHVCLGSLGSFPREMTFALDPGGREFTNQEFLSAGESSEIPQGKAGSRNWELCAEEGIRWGGESSGWRGAGGPEQRACYAMGEGLVLTLQAKTLGSQEREPGQTAL